MTAGTMIGPYRVLEDFRVVGAGLSEWTFAEREGREYFLKRFLSPTYPDDDAPGSERTKARKRARCAAFEAHHRGIQAALAPITSYGGNLIATLDFFRAGAKYYKVTEKVDVAGLDPRHVAALPFATQLVLLKTVAHSLKILHDLRIVHSDLKPSNVLIKRTELGYTTKLIDFDSSYVVGDPPSPEDIVGTMNYYSPELVRYIQGTADGAALTTASDIFALGLIYTEYLTGAPPPFPAAHHEPAIALLNGERLQVPPDGLPAEVVDLVDRMMAPEPADRPSVGQVHAELMTIRTDRVPTRATVIGSVPARPPARPPAGAPARSPAGAARGPSTLRGKGLRLAGDGGPVPVPSTVASGTASGTGTPAAARPTEPSGLVGRLVGRLRRADHGEAR